MSWTTMLEVKYFNKRMNDRHDYKTEFFGDAQWKQAANTVDQIIKENGPENIHSIYLGKYCHWVLDDGTTLVPDECKCAECRSNLDETLNSHPVTQRRISKAETLRILLIEKKNNPDFIKFVSD